VVRRLAVAAAVAVLAVGCGGATKEDGPPAPTTVAGVDRGKIVIDAFVAAAGRRDARAMWRLLSGSSQRRLGSFQRFRRTTAIEFAEGVGSFARSAYKVVVSERVTDLFGAVAIAGVRTAEGMREYAAYGTALRLENGSWRVEFRGPVHIEPLGPRPGTREKTVVQTAAEVVDKRGGLQTAVTWVDGVALDSQFRGGSRGATLFANLASPLARGRHNVVVFAGGAKDASVIVWTFSVH
jgi:hypothetical protein